METNAVSNEDKLAWCNAAIAVEEDFVKRVAPLCGINVIINPEKSTNKYAADLWLPQSQRYADLKHQETPFFTARRYNLDPQFAVTFNVKDWKRYRDLYPGIVIYFWVNWKQTTYRDQSVQPLEGVWGIPFSRLSKAAKSGRLPRHIYQNRIDDENGNAKESFMFDVRYAEQVWLNQ